MEGRFNTTSSGLNLTFDKPTISDFNVKVCQSQNCKNNKEGVDIAMQLSKTEKILKKYFEEMFAAYVETLKGSSGVKSLEEMFSAVSSGLLVHNNDHSYEEALVANLAAIKARDNYDVVESTFYAYLKNAEKQTIRHDLHNQLVADKIINLASNQMAVVFSQRLVNQFARVKFDDFKNRTYSLKQQFVQDALAGMDLDLNMGSLKEFFSGLPSSQKEDEAFSLKLTLLDHSNASLPLLTLNDGSTTTVFFGLQAAVLSAAGDKLFTVQMDVQMKGQIWYNSNSMDFKDLTFTMSNSKVLTQGVAHRSNSDMFYSAASNFMEKYVSINFENFILTKNWDQLVDNQFLRVNFDKIYVRKGLLSFKLNTYWKKDMDAILEALKNKN